MLPRRNSCRKAMHGVSHVGHDLCVVPWFHSFAYGTTHRSCPTKELRPCLFSRKNVSSLYARDASSPNFLQPHLPSHFRPWRKRREAQALLLPKYFLTFALWAKISLPRRGNFTWRSRRRIPKAQRSCPFPSAAFSSFLPLRQISLSRTSQCSPLFKALPTDFSIPFRENFTAELRQAATQPPPSHNKKRKNTKKLPSSSFFSDVPVAVLV